MRGVVLPLLDCMPSEITIANRTASKAQELAQIFGVKACGLNELSGHFDVVINGTSGSLNGDLPAVSDGILANSGLVYDMMYGNEPTAFLRHAQKLG